VRRVSRDGSDPPRQMVLLAGTLTGRLRRRLFFRYLRSFRVTFRGLYLLDHIIALDFPRSNPCPALADERHSPRIFVFGRLISHEGAIEELRANSDNVVDLSALYETDLPRLDSKETLETEALLAWESNL
jgi:hypothetical protein